MESKKEISYQYAVICSMITTITACSLLDEFANTLKEENYYKPSRHNLKLSEGEYRSWIERVFYFDKYSRTKNEDIRRIYKLCQEASKKLSTDVMLFRLNICNFLHSHDVDSANSLSSAVIICSLLKLAIDFCNLAQKSDKLADCYRRTLDIVSPKQLFNNVRGIYKYLPMPEDLDVNESTNIQICMSNYADKLSNYYVEYFTEN